MIADVPAATPETMPDEEPTVATDVVPLVQVPPEVVFDNVVVEPAQTFIAPVIAASVGRAFTVTTAVTDEVQPKPLV